MKTILNKKLPELKKLIAVKAIFEKIYVLYLCCLSHSKIRVSGFAMQ